MEYELMKTCTPNQVLRAIAFRAGQVAVRSIGLRLQQGKLGKGWCDCESPRGVGLRIAAVKVMHLCTGW